MLKKTIFGFIILSIFSISIALEVFVWDFDMGYQIANLDEGGTYSVETAIVNALNESGIYPEVAESLPLDLSVYDVIFVSLGVWCNS